ncbi:putative LRR receptor-like serine/threonine-protein kinase [Arachis hypogaea]|nr:putative LRR receptor-like serine/threonine-protein kinase [Arachis hypogaea]
MHAMAKKIADSLFLLLGALSFVATVQGQDQSDCGLPENSNYTEESTGINYISDANFIDSGVIMRRDVMLVYRYKDDPYDRIWEPYWDDRWTQLSSGLSNDGLNLNSFKPPAVVMETAATPKNATDSLDFQWEDDYTDNNETQHQYYFYLYFAELRKLGANQTSSFNITLNDSPWARMELVYESSSLPPIINALEIYLVKDFSSQLETQKDDVDAVTNMKRTYKVDSRNWEGDPCAPIAYKWQGVDCTSYDGFLRITSL